MKKALLSALIVVAIYFIILVSLQYGLGMDPSEGGPGWLYVIFVIGGTPAFLIIAVSVFFTNYYLHRNPNSALALMIKTKAFQYPRNITLLFLVIVIIIEVLLNVASNYYPAWGLSPGLFLSFYTVFFNILVIVAFFVGLKGDKKNRDQRTSK
jgi:hypothetical protein